MIDFLATLYLSFPAFLTFLSDHFTVRLAIIALLSLPISIMLHRVMVTVPGQILRTLNAPEKELDAARHLTSSTAKYGFYGAAALIILLSSFLISFAPASFFLSVAGLFLLACSCIDAKTYLLPDILTLPFLWIGLLAAASGFWPISPASAIFAASVCYGLFRLLDSVGYKFYKKTVLAPGDAKLVAGIGAWCGLMDGFTVIFVASLLALIYGLCKQNKKNGWIPYGPFLAVATYVMLIKNGA